MDEQEPTNTSKKVYEDKAPFRVIKVGNNYRIIKSSFDNWLDGSMQDIS